MTHNGSGFDSGSPGRILVVDDVTTKRLKIAKAAQNLGHHVIEAEGGLQALEIVASQPIDLILLDLLMPEFDGFKVLESLQADNYLRNIPVIVISGLDDRDSISRAIQLGAEDYLEEQFRVEILNARIEACLEKKRIRDIELNFLMRIDLLTDAATTINTGDYNPDALKLRPVTAVDDALGQFGRIFTNMSEQIFRRERRLRQQVVTLKNILLLFATGAVLGLGMPLSRIASELQPHPFGIALWVNVMAAVLGVGYAIARKRLPVINRQLINFLLVWGVLTASGFVLIFWVAAHVAASALSIVMVTEGLVVFIIAAIFGIERPTPKRLIGLSLGFVGIVSLIMTQQGLEGAGQWIWIVLALLVPLNFALEDLLMAAKMPEGVDLVAIVGLTALVAAILLLPLVVLLSDFFAISLVPGKLELTLLLLALKTLIGMSLLAQVIATAGAVFGSQAGYIKAFAGIVWSMLLLQESLPWVAWLSFGIILAGLILVESGKSEPLPDETPLST